MRGKALPLRLTVHIHTNVGPPFQTQHVGPIEGCFTGPKSIVNLISRSADKLCVLYYL